jgi:ribonuclease HII
MRYIIGADEVGRGCVAGDVFVCAVAVPEAMPKIDGVRDSKKLSAGKREFVREALLSEPKLKHRLARRTAKDIDGRGISRCLRECFEEAVNELLEAEDEVAEVRIDGNPFSITTRYPVRFIVKGDDSEWVIGAASIIAKVERDWYMGQMALVYPQYGFDKSKGYGVPYHEQAIRQHGPCPLHRHTFISGWLPNEAGSVFDLFG